MRVGLCLLVVALFLASAPAPATPSTPPPPLHVEIGPIPIPNLGLGPVYEALNWDALVDWRFAAQQSLLGAPDAPFIRSVEPLALRPTPGMPWEVVHLHFNLGTRTFEGNYRIEVPEIGVLVWEQSVMLPPGWYLLSWPSADIPWDAPMHLTTRASFIEHPEDEDGGQLHGEPLERVFELAPEPPCRPAQLQYAAVTAGPHAFWDMPWMSVQFCNDTGQAARVLLLVHDEATGRPLMEPTEFFAAATPALLSGHAPPLVTLTDGHGGTGLMMQLEAASPPVTIRPVLTLAWQGGHVEQVRLPPVEFGPTGTPYLPQTAPPLPGP